MRMLIVNADDFGRSAGINRGVVRAHESGIVTSASLMVRWPAAAEAATYARRRLTLDLGLHIDLGEWRCHEGTWFPVYEVVPLDDEKAVAAELELQVDEFRRLAGAEPTHFDSHQHVHRGDPIRSLVIELGERIGVPVRMCREDIRYCGAFYGQSGEGELFPEAIGADALIRVVQSLPEGVTELACHPGEGDDFDSPYSVERGVEVRTLCDPRVRAALDGSGVQLGSFSILAPGCRGARI